MKVQFNRSALQEALGLVTSVVPGRTPKPILQCLCIRAEAEAVYISATDLEVGITYKVSHVQVQQEGTVVVPADKITSIVRESCDELLECQAQDAAVHIKGADSRFTIYGQEASQYPAEPAFEGDGDLVIDIERLQEGIEQTVFAAARESTRYALNGVLWEVNGKKLLLVATDGRRLAKSTISLDKTAAAPKGSIIVPCKTMALLGRIPRREGATVSVKFMDNQIALACEPVVIASNLVEGNFPRYEDIIPKDYQRKIELPREALLSAVRRAALLVNEDSKGVKLALENGRLLLTSRTPEAGDAQVDMSVDYSGEPMEIGFNPQYIIDALRVLKTDSVELHLGQSDRPGLIKSGQGFLYLVMPVNL